MGDIFGSLYCSLFENLFGLDLADYLWGLSSPYQTTNMYLGIGLTMTGISLVMVVLYYYIINPAHPRWSSWFGWLVYLVINAVINFFVGWQWTLNHYYAGKMVAPDATTGMEVALNIEPSDCVAFGVANMLLSILFFFVLSMLLKWKSTNNLHSPF